ncbi:MAG TPA: phosphotransferase, partial [Burkholderiaceae bacterium]|nr:phosphotransferase [Burkholderiaceae bacterium]
PAPGDWAGPHVEGGWRVTLWQRLDLTEGVPDPAAAGRALARCHALLKTLPATLADSPVAPWAPLHEAERLLAHPQVRERAGADLGWVADRLARLSGGVLHHPAPRQWLHGDAHLNNSRPLRSGEPVWLDWEDACLAPLEWDLAGLVGAARVLGPLADAERAWAEAALAGWRDALASGPPIDAALLERCIELRALFIVAWSWWLGSRTPQQAGRLAARLAWLRGRTAA